MGLVGLMFTLQIRPIASESQSFISEAEHCVKHDASINSLIWSGPTRTLYCKLLRNAEITGMYAHPALDYTELEPC